MRRKVVAKKLYSIKQGAIGVYSISSFIDDEMDVVFKLQSGVKDGKRWASGLPSSKKITATIDPATNLPIVDKTTGQIVTRVSYFKELISLGKTLSVLAINTINKLEAAGGQKGSSAVDIWVSDDEGEEVAEVAEVVPKVVVAKGNKAPKA